MLFPILESALRDPSKARAGEAKARREKERLNFIFAEFCLSIVSIESVSYLEIVKFAMRSYCQQSP